MIILKAFLILGILGIIFGIILGIAGKVFYVKEDKRLEEITKMLPNYNCGACGNAGCKDFASKILSGEAKKLSACKPGKKDANFNKIIEYLKDDENIKIEI